MKNQLLLIKDVDHLGRSGDIVAVKPGYARNFLIPMGCGVMATKQALSMRARLVAEREKQAQEDRKDAEAMAKRLASMALQIQVKVDPDGHMYGSVTAADIIDLLENQGISLEKKQVDLRHPLKELGTHRIAFKFKEGIVASCELTIEGDHPVVVKDTAETPHL